MYKNDSFTELTSQNVSRRNGEQYTHFTQLLRLHNYAIVAVTQLHNCCSYTITQLLNLHNYANVEFM